MTNNGSKGDGPGGDGRPEGGPRKGSVLDTIKAIGWGFFGVRARRAHAHDVAHLKPGHVIIVGLAMAAVFVLVLVSLARWAVG